MLGGAHGQRLGHSTRKRIDPICVGARGSAQSEEERMRRERERNESRQEVCARTIGRLVSERPRQARVYFVCLCPCAAPSPVLTDSVNASVDGILVS